jgi:hypothetical protein
MAHDFKIGETVKCIDDGGEKFVQVDGYYVITAVGRTTVAVMHVAGLHSVAQFEPVTVTAPGYVKELTVTFTQTSRALDIEGRLMAAWLEVPPNCCRACSAPLPCSYHPNG